MIGITVFHIISHIAMGGAERVAVNLATSGTDGAVYHVVEVSRGNDAVTQTLLKELCQGGVRVHRAPLSHHKLSILLFPLRLLLLMQRHRADVLHTHTEIPDVSMYLWHCCFGRFFPHTRYVRTIHNTELWISWKALGKHVERFFQRKGANIAIGKGTAFSYQREYGETPPIIPNGVAELPQSLFPGLEAEVCNVLFAGRMEPQKGVLSLIETVKRLADRADIVFHIVGTGPLRAEIERELGTLPTVRLYDRLPGLASCLGGLDYVFMPSEFEGLVLFSLEATLAGVPVIANSCPGLEETLPPDWPLMAQKNDAETYVRLLTTPRSAEERTVLISQAQAHVRKNFSLSAMRAGYEQLYLRKTR